LTATGKVWKVGKNEQFTTFVVPTMCLLFFEIYKRDL